MELCDIAKAWHPIKGQGSLEQCLLAHSSASGDVCRKVTEHLEEPLQRAWVSLLSGLSLVKPAMWSLAEPALCVSPHERGLPGSGWPAPEKSELVFSGNTSVTAGLN